MSSLPIPPVVVNKPFAIDHTKKVLADLGKLVIECVSIVKHFNFITVVPKMLIMAGEIKDLIAECPQAFPELKNVDSVEAGQLASASYDMVKTIIAAVVAK